MSDFIIFKNLNQPKKERTNREGYRLIEIIGYFTENNRLFYFKKKLVTRLPNFPDRRIRYESFLLKNVVTNKIKFLEFLNFFMVGVGKKVVFLLYLDISNFFPANLAPYCTY